jgi:hypothetical protein
MRASFERVPIAAKFNVFGKLSEVLVFNFSPSPGVNLHLSQYFPI